MNKVQIKFISDAMDQPEKLTVWEYDFVNSLADLPEEKELTTKQNEVLNHIQRKLD